MISYTVYVKHVAKIQLGHPTSFIELVAHIISGRQEETRGYGVVVTAIGTEVHHDTYFLAILLFDRSDAVHHMQIFFVDYFK